MDDAFHAMIIGARCRTNQPKTEKSFNRLRLPTRFLPPNRLLPPTNLFGRVNTASSPSLLCTRTMSWIAWLSLISICLLGAISPGPSLAVVVRHTLGGSRKKGILCAWAHSLGIGFYAMLTILGLAILIQEAPLLFQGLSLAGALFLAWLGIQALRKNSSISEKLAGGRSTSTFEAARDGLAISLLNPKILLFFLALFSQLVPEAEGIKGRVAMVITPVIIDGMWYTLVALLLSQPFVLSRLKAHATAIDRLTGVALILLAIRVLIKT